MGQRQNLSRIEPMTFPTLVRCSNHLAAKDSRQAGPYKHNLKIYDLYLFIYLFIYLTPPSYLFASKMVIGGLKG